MGGPTAGAWCCSAGNSGYHYSYRAQLAYISSLPRWARSFYHPWCYYHAIPVVESHNAGAGLLPSPITAIIPGGIFGISLSAHFQLVPQPATGHRGKTAGYAGLCGTILARNVKEVDSTKNSA
ncbi:hypothetical protein ES703_62694 [subsurface metagenome]